MSIPAIFYKEVTESILTFRNVTTMLLCLVLFLTSVILLYNDYQSRLTNYELRDTKGQFYFGSRPKLAKRPTPLSVLVRGLDPDMGRLAVVWDSQPQNAPGGNMLPPGEKNYLLSLFRAPDFAYVVKTVMSLLALFFAFDVICGEKERGTLRLVLANSVSRSSILLGKWLGGYVSFLMCVLLGLALMLIVMAMLQMVSLGTEDWLRIGAILILTFIYLSLFFSLGLFVSTRVHRPETALILILLVWLIWVVGVPNLSSEVAKRLYPIPTASDIARQKHDISYPERVQAMLEEGLDERSASERASRDIYEQFWQINDDAIRMVRNQATLAQYLSRLSPLGSFVSAATTMARTGMEDAHRYKAYVIHWDKERREHEGVLFSPAEMSLEDSFSAIIVDLGLLILFNFVFFMGAYLSFLRYDIR